MFLKNPIRKQREVEGEQTMFCMNEENKKVFKAYADELKGMADSAMRMGNPLKPSVEAVAELLSKFADMYIPFHDLERFCYFLIKDADKKLDGVYYTPDEALEVVKKEQAKEKNQ